MEEKKLRMRELIGKLKKQADIHDGSQESTSIFNGILNDLRRQYRDDRDLFNDVDIKRIRQVKSSYNFNNQQCQKRAKPLGKIKIKFDSKEEKERKEREPQVPWLVRGDGKSTKYERWKKRH